MHRVFFIAEIGLNHNGDFNLAKKMIDAAKEVGADAVKFQSIQADKLISPKSFSQRVHDFGFDDVKTVGDFWKRVSINKEFQTHVSKYCKKVDIEFMSTPFDLENADIIDELGVRRFKIASGDITHYPLLAHIAHKSKPIILSTGASTVGEIEEAVGFIKKNGVNDITLLHCVSLYPTPAKLANLNAISYLKSIFKLPVGFSDHTMGYHVSIAAVAIGATVIEKHFTLDKNLPGPDQKLSANPEEFRKMVEHSSEVFESILEDRKIISVEEKKTKIVMRRSVVAARNLKKGKVIELNDLEFKRPGDGVSAKHFFKLLGKKLKRNILADEKITFGDISD